MLKHLRDKDLIEYYDKMKSLSKREIGIKLHSYDVKFSYHLCRLVNEAEQILVEHDLDLERNSEQLKSIRRGEWTLENLEDWFEKKIKVLEGVYATSTLRNVPDEVFIKNLLVECLEIHYGNLSDAIVIEGKAELTLKKIKELLND